MDETLEGYAWLPRIIDKARAYDAGMLGSCVHPCPVDQRCLGLLGVTSYAELTPRHLTAAPPANLPDTFSAFPLLGE